MKPYKTTRVQPLSDRHKEDRKTFCQWLLDHPEDFVQKIIFGDEKKWVLKYGANRQNNRYWAIHNPYLLDETKIQGQTKYMCLVTMVNGKVQTPHWFVDEDLKPFNENAANYIEAIENHILPQFTQPELEEFWWQQDGIYHNLYLVLWVLI